MRRVKQLWGRGSFVGVPMILLALLVVASVAMVATACSDSDIGDAAKTVASAGPDDVAALAGAGDATLTAQATEASITWTGNGSNNNCPLGGTLHWILTPGGNADILSGSLTVTFSGGGSQTVSGQFQGGGGGAMHFYTTGTSPVATASASYTYDGTQRNPVLTISSSVCNTTSTTSTSTTSTTSTSTTSTTSTSTTSTTSTSTTSTTSTTVPTTSTDSTTTTSTSTTTTSTTEPPTTSTDTTEAETTTTTGVVSPETSTPTTGGASTTQGGVTTAPSVSVIHTGGGGTAGMGAGQWALVILAGLLALGLAGSAVVTRQKVK